MCTCNKNAVYVCVYVCMCMCIQLSYAGPSGPGTCICVYTCTQAQTDRHAYRQTDRQTRILAKHVVFVSCLVHVVAQIAAGELSCCKGRVLAQVLHEGATVWQNKHASKHDCPDCPDSQPDSALQKATKRCSKHERRQDSRTIEAQHSSTQTTFISQ